MFTWYDPHAGDERREQMLRIQRLPQEIQWLRYPASLYRHLGHEEDPEGSVMRKLEVSGVYRDDPQSTQHIIADARLLWTWARHWFAGKEERKRTAQRRKT